MRMHLSTQRANALLDIVRSERRAFAAKIRIVRAVLGWSQADLAVRAGLTQRAIHKLEQGDTDPRRTTVLALEQLWREEGVAFEDAGDGFSVTVRHALLEQPDKRGRGELTLVTGRKALRA
jgi:transcriptional regulator with XRE-family HTH domain